MFAHEYGHAALSHPPRNFDFGDFWPWKHSPETNASAFDEIEADVYALRVLLEKQHEALQDPEENPFFQSILYSVEFYWLSRLTLEKARELQGASNLNHSGVALAEVDVWSNEDLDVIAACTIDYSCDVRSVLRTRQEMRLMASHPPHEFRARLVRKVIEALPPERKGVWDDVAGLVNENVAALWERAEPRFVNR